MLLCDILYGICAYLIFFNACFSFTMNNYAINMAQKLTEKSQLFLSEYVYTTQSMLTKEKEKTIIHIR